ncbi:hypothetical protein [Brevundimonas sp.]|uniref:hypothetical protein n=1 Tax=Brevundimonas sp. TaxID=1871086 RepID=UPI00356AB848
MITDAKRKRANQKANDSGSAYWASSRNNSWSVVVGPKLGETDIKTERMTSTRPTDYFSDLDFVLVQSRKIVISRLTKEVV